MEIILSFVKKYFILMLVILICSYLTPKESYRKYCNYFMGVLMVVILLRPFFAFTHKDAERETDQVLREVEEKLFSMEYQEKGENIFEQFLGKDSEEK